MQGFYNAGINNSIAYQHLAYLLQGNASQLDNDKLL